MTDESKGQGPRRRLIAIAAGLGAVVLGAAVVLGLLGREPPLGPSSPPERIAAAFDRDMASVPALAPWREEMQRDFPDLYDQMRQAFVGHVQSGESKAEAMQAALATIWAYRRMHQGAVVQASEATLTALTAQNLAAMNLYRTASDEVCARYVMTGDVQGGSPEQLLAVSKRGALTFKAIHEGETAPVEREPLDPAEAASFKAALAAQGLGPDLIRRVFEGGLDRVTAADQCRIGKGIVDALARLPAPIAAKITAALAANNS